MIDEVEFNTKDYFCYTRTKRSSKRKLNSMKLSKHFTKSQLSSKNDELQSGIYKIEGEFKFMPDNIDDNPDIDVQEIIQDRIKALDLLTSEIQELTQSYISRNEKNSTSKTKNDGMSDLTMDEKDTYIQQANTQTLQNIQEHKKTMTVKIQKTFFHWHSSKNRI